MTRRPNPGQALAAVLAAANRAAAEAVMRRMLARAWAAGRLAGFDEGVCDANHTDLDGGHTRACRRARQGNPYHR